MSKSLGLGCLISFTSLSDNLIPIIILTCQLIDPVEGHVHDVLPISLPQLSILLISVLDLRLEFIHYFLQQTW